MKLYDPATQQRQIRERMHALDLINERFARYFRVSLFNMLRRSSDVTVTGLDFINASTFNKGSGEPMSYNVFSLKPLRGNALVSFPSRMIFMAVESLFGGDGKHVTTIDQREFSLTEQRIIEKMTRLALDCYKHAWSAVFNIDPEYIRSEIVPKFVNIANAESDTLVNTTFHVEFANFECSFNVTFPYSMVEPIRPLLSNMANDHYNDDPKEWSHRMGGEIQASFVELVSNFLYIDTSISKFMGLKVGDILPVSIPEEIEVMVDSVPVLKCICGSKNGRRALLVKETINHALNAQSPSPRFIKGLEQGKGHTE